MIHQIALVAAATLTVLAAEAAKPKAPWAHYNLNFPAVGTTKPTWENHLGMCDDSYYGGFTVSIPGRLGVDFTVEKPQWDGECTIQGQRAEENERTGAVRTRFFIKGQCDSQLIFKIIGQPKRAIVMDMTSAC